MDISSRYPHSSRKRPRSVEPTESGDSSEAEVSDQGSAKRRRTAGPQGAFGAFKYALKTVWNFFMGDSERASTPRNARRSDLNASLTDKENKDDVR